MGYIDYWDITIRYDYRLKGTVEYLDQDDNSDYPLRKVRVVLHEDSPEGPELDSAFTDDDGRYVMDYEPVDGNIYPVVVFSRNPIADILDYDNMSGGPITAPPDEGKPPGDTVIDLHIWRTTEISLSAAHVWDYIITEREWMREHTSNDTAGRHDIIKCFIDFNEFTASPRYVFNPMTVEDSIIFTDYKFPEWSWNRMTIFHEYTHAIFVETYHYNVYLDDTVSPHYANTVSQPGFAFFEGWAEFMSCIIPEEDSTRIIQDEGNIETNEWWKGPDGNNNKGSWVEGAVASALYDMQDYHWDSVDEWNPKDDTTADLYGMFADIFRIIQKTKPSNIKLFVQAWKDNIEDDYLKNSTVSIMRNHGIKVSYIAEDDFIIAPQSFALFQNYPNPFNSQTTIDYHIPLKGMVNLTIYNILGQKVKTCVNEKKDPGYYTYFWDGKNDRGIEVGSGVYIYRMSFGDKKVSKPMVLLK